MKSHRKFGYPFTKAVVLSCMVSAIYSIQAQQVVTSATLAGSVLDGSERIIAGALLTVQNLETNQRQTTTTDREGRYRFPYLAVGDYELAVSAPGFTPLTQRLSLTIGQTINVPIRLTVASLTEKVTVLFHIPAIETTRTQVTETILPEQIDSLPLNGRNYLDLAILVPAVSPTNTGSNQRFAETSAVPGQGISIAGQRNLANSFVVDGMSANDDAADLTGTFYSEEVIREFQVITSGGIAEFGRASGGVINILTNSGTNQWRGRLYGFGRNDHFDARNPLASKKDALNQAQYGVTLGGPLRRNRTFLFSNFEQMHRDYSVVVTVSSSAVATINSLLHRVNYSGPDIESGITSAGFRTTNYFARVDHEINQHNQLSARYSAYHITANNSRTVGGLNAISRGSGLDNTDQSLAISDITTINNRALNEARFQFTHSRLQAPINDSVGPAVSISGVANFGTATSSPLARSLDSLELLDNVSLLRGSHSFKSGADFLYNRVDILFPGAKQGSYNFSSLANFLAGKYQNFQQSFGAPSQFQANPNVGFFVQDEWRASPHLTFNAGLRYDLQFLPGKITTDSDNFAPRLGLAFSPGNRKTVVRASAGLYYDRIPLRATSNALQRDGTKYVVVQLAPGQPGAPIFPNVLAVIPNLLLTKPNITRIDPNIEASYGQQSNVQIERQLSGSTSISIGYLHLRGRHIIVSRNLNVPRFPASAGVDNLGRPDPNWGNISTYESSGDSYYNGMIVSLNKQARDWGNLRVSYTLSKAIDDTGNFFFSTPQDNFNLRDDQGLSDNDQRHRLAVSGFLQIPSNKQTRSARIFRNFQLSYIYSWASSLPFNIVTGNDRNLDSNNNDRPSGVARNSGRGFAFSSLDLRISRRFNFSERVNLQLMAEGFNVFNHPNFAVPNNTFGVGVAPNSTFGQPTAAFDPRQLQFGLRLSF